MATQTILVPELISIGLGVLDDMATGAGNGADIGSRLQAAADNVPLPQRYIDAGVTRAVWVCVGSFANLAGDVGGLFELRPFA